MLMKKLATLRWLISMCEHNSTRIQLKIKIRRSDIVFVSVYIGNRACWPFACASLSASLVLKLSCSFGLLSVLWSTTLSSHFKKYHPHQRLHLTGNLSICLSSQQVFDGAFRCESVMSDVKKKAILVSYSASFSAGFSLG